MAERSRYQQQRKAIRMSSEFFKFEVSILPGIEAIPEGSKVLTRL